MIDIVEMRKLLELPLFCSDNPSERVKDSDANIVRGYKRPVGSVSMTTADRQHWNYLYYTMQNAILYKTSNSSVMWHAETNYDKCVIIFFDDPNLYIYRSLIDNNKGNDPLTSPASWDLVYSIII